jgi:hypothetical protein
LTDETVVRRSARRGSSSGSGATTVARPFEEREIVLAQGIEFHNECYLSAVNWSIPASIGVRPNGREVALDIVEESERSFTYVSSRQRVRFHIRIVDTKDEFKTALQTPGLHVIYSGHARYGRGPCFGDVNVANHTYDRTDESQSTGCNLPGDNWEDGTDAARFGLFRMGYPYLAVPVSEVIKHGYRTSFARADTTLPRQDCHPDVRRQYRRLRGLTLAELDSEGRLGGFCNNAAGADTRFWGGTWSSHGSRKRHVVLVAGWSGSSVDPMDLGATEMRCRVFCHFGCSTFKHNYRVTRMLKGWRRTDTDHFAYWTTGASYSDIDGFWLYHLFKYRRRNAFESWRRSLRYALSRTNRDLRASRRRYRLI